jgi:tetratricopeptide (TPR) repeat protein
LSETRGSEQPPRAEDEADGYDVFLSHASEDKVEIVEDLHSALVERGVRVWYDRVEIHLGDDLRRKMEHGLGRSRFGVVVLSPSFLTAKYWTEQELSALFSLESASGDKRILPVLHGIEWAALVLARPFLASRLAATTADGVDAVADQIRDAVRASAPAPARRASPLYNVPLPTSTFVGRRRELDALARLLREKGDVRVCTSIEGLPGVGKTELVLRLAHDLAKAGEFPGGIFWLPAEDPDLTTAWAADPIAARLGATGTTAAERAKQVMGLLARRGAPVLVILDNVERWDAGGQPAPLPEAVAVTLLVTTRRRNLGGNRFRALQVDVLRGGDDRELLLKIAGTAAAAKPGFDDLLLALDGHALALELAGVYLREYPEVTPAGYVRLLAQGDDPAAKVAGEILYAKSADQALDLLWQRLDPSTRRLWQLASLFAAAPASAALADACGLDGDGRRALHRYHLVDLNTDGSFRMHRLVRAFGQRGGAETDRAVARSAFIDGVTRRAKEIDLAAGAGVYPPDRAHFADAVRLIREGAPGTDASQLFDRVGKALHSMGELGPAKQILEQALASDLENFGEDHPSVAASRANLARVLLDLGDLPRARQLSEQILEFNLEVLGEDHPTVAVSRANLARVLRALGDLSTARQLLELALESNLKNPDEGHATVAVHRSNLALVLKDLGDLPTARQLLELALESNIENLGENHPTVAVNRSNLAGVLKNLGDLPTASQLLERALASDLENFDEDHPIVATHQYNLAIIREDTGDLAGASKLLDAVVRAETVSLGPNHPSLAVTRARRASVLFRTGATNVAREEAREAWRIVSAQPAGSFHRREVERLTAPILAG